MGSYLARGGRIVSTGTLVLAGMTISLMLFIADVKGQSSRVCAGYGQKGACWENCANGYSCTTPFCSCDADDSQANSGACTGAGGWHRGTSGEGAPRVWGQGTNYNLRGNAPDGCGDAQSQGSCIWDNDTRSCSCSTMNPAPGAWVNAGYIMGRADSCAPCGQ
jgi:hypothetical protein